MNLSKNGLEFNKREEGFRRVPYKDIGGKWTIGTGHLIKKGETFDNWTDEQFDQLHLDDMKIAIDAVNSDVTVPLTQNQFDALADFVFNEGITSFKISNLLFLLNNGDYEGASNEFIKWNKVTINNVKVASIGLTDRRLKEKELFLTPDNGEYEKDIA